MPGPVPEALAAAQAAAEQAGRTAVLVAAEVGIDEVLPADRRDAPAIPLAAAELLNPLIAGLAMGLSSVSVVANALRLRRFRAAR
jgi:hypothetical protein